MTDKTTRQGWEKLAGAVILRAVRDYAEVCRRLEKRPDLKAQAKEKQSLERFFRSDWFQTLCAMNGAELNTILEKEIRKHDSRQFSLPVQDPSAAD